MAYLNTSITGLTQAVELDLGQEGGRIWSEFQFPVGATVTTNDVIDMYFNGTALGYDIMDVKVFMEQVDTHATPTVAWNIGVESGGGNSGISGSTGLRWGTNVPLGRSFGGDVFRPTSCSHLLQCGHTNRIGLSCSVLPATPAWDGKRVWMCLEVIPSGSIGDVS